MPTLSADGDRTKRYEKIDFLGEGQFATVYKAKDTQDDNKIVAVKKIKVGQRSEAADGINRTALREIKLLQELKHENIIGLVDVFGHKSNISLVYEFCDTDLELIIKDSSLVLQRGHVKSYMMQTLKGLEYLHANWILHRDMKPNNLLIDTKGVLKIADFGLAKLYGSPSRVYTHQVVTRWYRCPELLFGARNYGVGVDIWAAGCILAELLLRVPFFPGESDLEQLAKIFQVRGTPTKDTWPGLTDLPDYIAYETYAAQPLRGIFTAAGDDLLLLLERLLSLNPLTRCTAGEALQMSYFTNKPYPTPGNLLPMPSSKANAEATRETAPANVASRLLNAGLKRKSEGGGASGALIKRLFV